MSLVVHKYESKESLARASASNHLEKQFLNKDHDMGFYNDKKTAQQYIAMAEGYDGRELVEVLSKFLSGGASVLELGMGPGIDLKLLNKHFLATGSDNSQFFLDRHRRTSRFEICVPD